MIQVETLAVGPFQSNTHVVWCDRTREAIVVDAGEEASRILGLIKNQKLEARMIVNTHAHIDHVSALGEVAAALGVPVLMCRKELPVYDNVAQQAALFGLQSPRLPEIDRFIADGDTIEFGELKCRVIEMPGHSPGSVTLYFAEETPPVAIVGDVLFAGSVGRTDLPWANHEHMMETLRDKIMALPDDTVVHSGHGPATTIGREKQTNPFLSYLT